jgi:DNA-binding transcriptional MerR regulator
MAATSWIGTGKAAKAVGIHPNTLRWYEEAGYLPTLPRTPAGYRKFSPAHLQLARIVKLSQPLLRIYGAIRRLGRRVLSSCREGLSDPAALERGKDENRELHRLLQQELELALRALEVVERWRGGRGPFSSTGEEPGESGPGGKLRRMVYLKEAAAITGLSRDKILSWERNGLLFFLRAPENDYRILGTEELNRLLVIRSCRTAGYSISAIKRLLDRVDEGMEAGSDKLRQLADDPQEAEAFGFPVFPTDTLPVTLEGLIAINETLSREIENLAGEIDTLENLLL